MWAVKKRGQWLQGPSLTAHYVITLTNHEWTNFKTCFLWKKEGNLRKCKVTKEFQVWLAKYRRVASRCCLPIWKVVGLSKDSYRYGQNTPMLIFENLKPVEKLKNRFSIIWSPSKVVLIFIFFYFSTGFRFSKITVEWSVHICRQLSLN